MKLLIWTSIPTHHQSAFFAALRAAGVDLVVHYYVGVKTDRIRLGWSNPAALPAGERRVPPRISAVYECADWRQRIHILPGCGRQFLFQLALFCSWNRLEWIHWSEPANPAGRWQPLKRLVRRLYAFLNNEYGSGALAIGELARRDFIRWGIRSKRIRLLPYSIAPVEIPKINERFNARCGVNFVFLGVLEHRKGIDLLLTAFSKVSKAYPDAKLTLVGHDKSSGTYRELAANLGVSAQTKFVDSVAAANIGQVLAANDVLVLASRFDGWGMVLSEAASAGLALIASDKCGAAYHLIENGTAGYMVPAGDVDALAAAMTAYCRYPETAKLHGQLSKSMFGSLVPQQNASRMREAIHELSGQL